MTCALRLAIGLVLVGCAGGKGSGSRAASDRDGGDAAATTPGDGAPQTPLGAAPPYLLARDRSGQLVGGTTLEVRVEWPAPAAALVTSPGIDSCDEPRRPPLRLHALDGVADVVVRLDLVGQGRSPHPPATVELAVGNCRIDPVVALATRLGDPIAVTSASERRQRVVVDYLGDPVDPVAEIDLPLVGRRYQLVGDRPGLYRFTIASEPASSSYVVVPPHPYFAVTDEAGKAVLTEVVPGSYDVVAWHRPLPDGTVPTATHRVTVTAAEPATVTLSLAP